MAAPHDPLMLRPGTTRRSALGLIALGPLVGACSGIQSALTTATPGPGDAPAAPPQQPATVGNGQVKVGLILPLTGQGNASVVAQSMKNAAEMALAEFQSPNIQLLIKDDGGTATGAQSAAQQALDEGAEIMLGPLFALSVPAAAQLTRTRNVPMIAFSTDSSVAGRGVYLLSFLPENQVARIVAYTAGTGKQSFAGLVPDSAYGNVVEAAFKQEVARRNGRVVAFEKYGSDRTIAVRNIAPSLASADALFLADDDGGAMAAAAEALAANSVNLKRLQLIGTGVWDNSRVFASAAMQGGLFAAPDPAGFNAFAGRYRKRYSGEPVRPAALSYDAVALVAALARTQGPQRFSETVLTNASGFAGIDGLFRFKADGTNERGLAVMRVASGGGQVVAASPKSFNT